MPNQFTPKRPIHVPIGPSVAYIELTQEQFAKVASYDVQRCSAMSWYAQWMPSCGHYRAVAFKKRKAIYLHAFILGTTGNEITADHVLPGDALNCLPHNLRYANQTQQKANQRKSIRNTSGFKGVSWDKSRGKWKAQARTAGGKTFIGRFKTKEEAHAAFCETVRREHGEFARTK